MSRLQILNENGDILDKNLEPDLSKETLIKALKVMIQVRMLNDKGIRLQRQGRVGFHIFTVGQEAHVGTAIALEEDDWVYPAYREHGIALYRGIEVADIVNHLFANERDPQKGRRLPGLFGDPKIKFVNPSAPIGTQIVQAAGTAYASKYRGDGGVTTVFFGDGATSSNDFHNGMNFGAVTKSPAIFICMNNQWAISVPLSKQTAQTEIYKKAVAYGMPGVQIDGNDIFAFYHAVKEATERARNGEGPTLIEAVTYRVGPHTSSDDPTRYRTDDEVKKWRVKDPIERFQKYLINKGYLSKKDIDAMYNEFEEQLNDLVDEADKLPKPELSTMFDDVFKEIPPFLQEQKEELLSFAEEEM